MDRAYNKEGLSEINRVVKQSMDLAQSITTHYPKDWKSQIGHFNLLMTFTHAVLPQKVTPKMTFTFADKEDCIGAWPPTVCSKKKKKKEKKIAARAAIHSWSEKEESTFTISLFSASLKRKARSIDLL